MTCAVWQCSRVAVCGSCAAGSGSVQRGCCDGLPRPGRRRAKTAVLPTAQALMYVLILLAIRHLTSALRTTAPAPTGVQNGTSTSKRTHNRRHAVNATRGQKEKNKTKRERENRSIEDSQVVPYLSTNSTVPRLTSQIGRDAVFSRSYGRGCFAC